MASNISNATAISSLDTSRRPTTVPAFTIGTLVSDKQQYSAMLHSLRSGGFSDEACQYLYIDNTQPIQTGAYRGLNAILDAAAAPVVILCHQDIRLIRDGRTALEERLTELTLRDPSWAVAGNAGGISPGRLALRITDPHGHNQNAGQFPQRVMSLDENFIVVRRDARIGFSHDLDGFHFYGADICLHASQMGRSAYVIDFHLEHLSPGRKGTDFEKAERTFQTKWSGALRPRWMQTTCTLVHLSGTPVRSTVGAIIDKPIAKITRRLGSVLRPAAEKVV